MRQFTAIILCYFIFFNISCNHKSAIVAPLAPARAAKLFNSFPGLAYGPDSNQQSFDLTLPVNPDINTTGVVVFIHGGGWSGGSKEDFNNLGMDTFFTARNCAVISMNYRLTDKYPYPAALDDIGSVLDHINSNAENWQVNPAKICLFGRSSGAHLALEYAYTHNSDRRIKVVVDCFGPVDFTRGDVVNGQLGSFIEAMLGPYTYNDNRWHDASPIYHLAAAVPTLIMQGTADSLVYASQSVELQDSLLARSIPSIYLSWIGNGHGWNQQRWIESRDVVAAWLKQYL